MSSYRNYIGLAVIVLLLTVFLQPFLSMRQFGPAQDEITHLPSGYSYLKTGRVELNPQHPPLVKLLAAAPLLLLDPRFSEEDLKLGEWKFGSKFLFENDADRLLFWGRILPISLSVLLAFFVFKWATELFNPWAGVTALILYAFMPNIIGHAQLVMTDLGVSAFSFITLYWLWRFFKSTRLRHLAYSGIFLGLALSSKFSGLLLIPIIVLLVIILLVQKGVRFPQGLGFSFKSIVLILGLAFLVVYAVYFFPGDLKFYWQGYQTLYADKNPDFNFYLNGNFSPTGWWYYFLWAFVIKTPIPFLLMIVGAMVFYKKLKLSPLDLSFVLIPPLVFFAITSWRAYNIGVRYVLPVYPFLILLASGSVEVLKSVHRRRLALGFLVILLVWQAYSAIRIFPDYLSYFNELVGGPADGYKYLDDSNISWGQDLKRLAAYQKKYPETTVIFHRPHYDLGYYGISNLIASPKKNMWSKPPPGRYAVDINYLIRAKFSSQKSNEPSLDWLSLYQPINRIGYSFLVYQF